MPDYKLHAKREETFEVGNDNAIKFLGPEGPRVLSTPHMIALMERTCRNLVLDMLDPGFDSVGTHVNVSHCGAAAMGASVTFSAELLSVLNRQVEFRVSARAGEKLIGEGFHQRTVIDIRRFKQKVDG